MAKHSNTTVVISTYDERRWGDLVACVDSLEQQTNAPLETIAVVDHNEALLERVRAAFPSVRAVANTRSRGLAGARNTGVELARGEFVAFVDDDARAEPQWLEQLNESLDNAGRAGVGAGGALLPRWSGREPRWLPHEFLWTVGCSYTGLPMTSAPIRNPIGANMVVRTEILRQIGGFREGTNGDAPRELQSRGVVRAGGNVPDDTDLAIRVSDRWPDAVWLYQPGAVVHHTVTPERATLSYFLRRCFEEGSGKAALVRYAGHQKGLSAERRHLATVLPRGVGRGIRDLIAGDPGGGLRAVTIIAGTLTAAIGFLTATAVGWVKK